MSECAERLTSAISGPTIIELNAENCAINSTQLIDIVPTGTIPDNAKKLSIAPPQAEDFKRIANHALEHACRKKQGKIHRYPAVRKFDAARKICRTRQWFNFCRGQKVSLRWSG